LDKNIKPIRKTDNENILNENELNNFFETDMSSTSCNITLIEASTSMSNTKASQHVENPNKNFYSSMDKSLETTASNNGDNIIDNISEKSNCV
jgi:hypothetical protein